MWKEKGHDYERVLQDWMMNALPKKDRAIDQIIVANLLSTPTLQPLGKNLERFHLNRKNNNRICFETLREAEAHYQVSFRHRQGYRQKRKAREWILVISE